MGNTLAAGYLQVYTGDGKGKSSAAFGLALRAAGHELEVYIGQFMKGRQSGEVLALSTLPNVTVEQFGSPHFVDPDNITSDDRARAAEGIDRVRQILREGRHALVILDEVNVALSMGLLSMAELGELLDLKGKQVELVCTGRYAPEGLLSLADLVTEMRPLKHYMDAGVPARLGIEY